MIKKRKLESINGIIEDANNIIDEHANIVANEIYNQIIVPFMNKYKLKIRYGMGGVYFEDSLGKEWDCFPTSSCYKKCVETLFDDISDLCSNFKPLKSDRNSSLWKIVGWYVMPEEKK